MCCYSDIGTKDTCVNGNHKFGRICLYKQANDYWKPISAFLISSVRVCWKYNRGTFISWYPKETIKETIQTNKMSLKILISCKLLKFLQKLQKQKLLLIMSDCIFVTQRNSIVKSYVLPDFIDCCLIFCIWKIVIPLLPPKYIKIWNMTSFPFFLMLLKLGGIRNFYRL